MYDYTHFRTLDRNGSDRKFLEIILSIQDNRPRGRVEYKGIFKMKKRETIYMLLLYLFNNQAVCELIAFLLSLLLS
jgi:hypothetical protein